MDASDRLVLTSPTFPASRLDEILAIAKPFDPDGHYLYPADLQGSHLRGFFAFEPIARHPEFVSDIAADIARWSRTHAGDFDVIFAPGSPAVRTLADAVGAAVGKPVAYWEYRPSGRFGDRLVDGSVTRGSRAVVFNAVSLNGRCVGNRLPAFVERLGGIVVAAAVFAKGTAEPVRDVGRRWGDRFYSTVEADVRISEAAACAMCESGRGHPIPWTAFAQGRLT